MMTDAMWRQLVREMPSRCFAIVWMGMEEAGQVEAVGGMQWSRVRREWFDAGCPVQLEDFILEHRLDVLPGGPGQLEA
jgi:hypothetical protein